MRQALRWQVSESIGSVSGLLEQPKNPRALYVLGHGAGANMHHAFMEGMAAALAERHIATLRYQFPFTEAQRRRPDVPAVLRATVQSALQQAHSLMPNAPLFAGGKSMGGRITAELCAKQQGLPGVRGMIFLGFPLHAAGKPATQRAESIQAVQLPMLFLQGSKDRLADLTLLTPICKALGKRCTLQVLDDADHGFAVPKRRGLSPQEVFAWLSDAVAAWIATVV